MADDEKTNAGCNATDKPDAMMLADTIDVAVNEYLNSPQGKNTVNNYANQAASTVVKWWLTPVGVLLVALTLVGYFGFKEAVEQLKESGSAALYANLEDQLRDQVEQQVIVQLEAKYKEKFDQALKLYGDRLEKEALAFKNTIASQSSRLSDLPTKVQEKISQVDEAAATALGKYNTINGLLTSTSTSVKQLEEKIEAFQGILASDDVETLDLIIDFQDLMKNSDGLEQLAKIRKVSDETSRLVNAISKMIDPTTGTIQAANGAVTIGSTRYGNGIVSLIGSNGQTQLRMEVDSHGYGKISIGNNLVVIGASTNRNGGIWIQNDEGVEITKVGSDTAGNGLIRTFDANGTFLNELSPLRMPAIQRP